MNIYIININLFILRLNIRNLYKNRKA